jgi:hypothetical protein
MAAQEDSLLSPITAAADRSESTTLLVAKVSYRATDRMSRAGPGYKPECDIEPLNSDPGLRDGGPTDIEAPCPWSLQPE